MNRSHYVSPSFAAVDRSQQEGSNRYRRRSKPPEEKYGLFVQRVDIFTAGGQLESVLLRFTTRSPLRRFLTFYFTEVELRRRTLRRIKRHSALFRGAVSRLLFSR